MSAAVNERKRAKYAADPAPYIKAAKVWAEANPERRAAISRRHGWRRQGIPVAAAEAALTAHGGTCDLCSAEKPGGRNSWHVDHDHFTGLVRGVLCNRCNLALGKVEAIGLRRIQRYLATRDGVTVVKR